MLKLNVCAADTRARALAIIFVYIENVHTTVSNVCTSHIHYCFRLQITHMDEYVPYAHTAIL